MGSINRVIEKNLCTGCGLCASLFSEKVKIDYESAFNRPVLDSTLDKVEEQSFKHICPGMNQNAPKKLSGFNQHTIWGNYSSSSLGHSNNDDIRYRASSGGILSQSAIYLLEAGLVDGVIHIKASKKEPLLNQVTISFSPSEVLDGAGSRYSPASPLAELLQTIQQNPYKKFCFIGKPCDVTALRNLIALKPDIGTSIPYLLSFFCAGTPSREGVDKVLQKLNVKPHDIIKFDFRGNGWPGKTIAETHKTKKEMSYGDSWGNILGPTIQQRCKICADGIGENADLVSADVWHSDVDGYPLFDESDGEGLILPRTNTGRDLVSEMVAKNIISMKPYDLDDLKGVQPTQFERKGSFYARALAKLVVQRTIPCFGGQRTLRAALKVGIKKNVRSFVGSFLRARHGKI
ncbi:Coenzyme F420 hydrogenase/dehydrogenase, beta subunit C-terminal domain [Grimontia kaedaensis]|uniref:Coenzyme F420 hydrogenase/dehydrogenase, beta subunit C-terminal domain n=1 Tax=Grimontia kaedaensis TaxID=2872157 RepID=A0ABY4WVH1_9GAMM|nr:Coenzyme F420 hydrogenase/dehydrogenase, beta subunit C-terminal domain [Grimontia kaedaensis]USH03290.1 Coenzyme F420 hydrogenase/dehydrogenase, beta subunit C-terminal domain [Grimontia kaedaensis]